MHPAAFWGLLTQPGTGFVGEFPLDRSVLPQNESTL